MVEAVSVTRSLDSVDVRGIKLTGSWHIMKCHLIFWTYFSYKKNEIYVLNDFCNNCLNRDCMTYKTTDRCDILCVFYQFNTNSNSLNLFVSPIWFTFLLPCISFTSKNILQQNNSFHRKNKRRISKTSIKVTLIIYVRVWENSNFIPHALNGISPTS